MTKSIIPPSDLADSAIFKRFQWHREAIDRAHLPGAAVMNFATKAHDISCGAKTILEILERDTLAESQGERQLLNASVQSDLLRMVIASLGMLNDSSESLFDWVHKHHMPIGAAVHNELVKA